MFTRGAAMTKQIEKTLFAAADKMRGKMDPGEYKYVALGLLFLRYVSVAFDSKHKELLADDLADAGDPEEYAAENALGARNCQMGSARRPR
jgi:type I restriction enzyme M protein